MARSKLKMITVRGKRAAAPLTVTELECLRCGHRWLPRILDVRLCPKCKTARFDTPRKKSA